MVSFLKAMYGDAAKKENDWAFHYLPKIDRKYSWTEMWDDMYDGKVKGLFAFGMNGVAIGPNSRKNIDALKKADWLVVGEIYPDETSEFWTRSGHDGRQMKTDQDDGLSSAVRRLCREGRHVRQLRALAAMEVRRPAAAGRRAGSIRKSSRSIFLKVRELYQKEGGKFPDPILNLRWPYTHARESVARRRSRERSTVRRSPTSPIRDRPGVRSKPASSCRASPG